MLKITYTESGVSLESLRQPLESWMNTRVLLALRSGTSLWLQPTTVSFVLPANLSHLRKLLDLVRENTDPLLSLSYCPKNEVEINLEGTWLSSEQESSEGIFVTTLSDSAESILCHSFRASFSPF